MQTNIQAQTNLTYLNRAAYFFDLFRTGKSAESYLLLDSTSKAAISQEQFFSLMPALEKQFGKFKSIIDTTTKTESNFQIIEFGCEFEKYSLTVKVTVDSMMRIAGFYFLPKASKSEYIIPEYVNPAKFKEIEVEFGNPEWLVHGTLSIPRRIEKPAVVILVHGSGPNDRNEAIGPNKTFKDIAWGLSSRGIAVLRYDKRTKEYGHKMKPEQVNVQNEVIDDALEAISFLQKREDVDTKKIFVIGHSLGAMLAPTIAEQSKQLAGIILLAGPARKLEDLILEQTEYILSLKTENTNEEKDFLTDLKNKIDSLKNKTLPSSSQLIGGPASYFYDLDKINQVETAKNLSIPVLILQGERDYQVTMTDFNTWQKELSNNKNVSLKSYTSLNHLFIKGEGKATPEEYNNPGTVDKEPVMDIITWIENKQ
jgi:dienelactone hydrolase